MEDQVASLDSLALQTLKRKRIGGWLFWAGSSGAKEGMDLVCGTQKRTIRLKLANRIGGVAWKVAGMRGRKGGCGGQDSRGL